MASESKQLYSRSKIWLEDADGKVVFGSGRLRILKAIEKTGSIHAAAKELKMGYRAVWARIHATEERLGEQLLEKRIGGSAGGGSCLTPLAEELVHAFTRLQQDIEHETDHRFQQLENILNIKITGAGSPV
ncbi:MAG: LysR family transcriptional regulator [Desulfobacteraceae bacterium]|nr:LysR family transcriptional regulator [Desulfobacteraceae bacterium]